MSSQMGDDPAGHGCECGVGSFLSSVCLQERQEMGSEHGLQAAWTWLSQS